jgi:EAL domain-containing protein (putative c-di-GMP-specific phosphodiesterase class I)
MSQSIYDNSWIVDLINEIMASATEKERTEAFDKYRNIHKNDNDCHIIQGLDRLSEELVRLRNSDNAVKHKLASLTDSERAELQEAEHIMDENQFEYYFQPIVNTIDGEIFSYEALMRPKSSLKLSPLHILKYAGLLNRLSDVEKDTFLNVLGLIETHKDEFYGKFVFINSIPEAKLNVDDFRKITKMLLKHSDTAVVEMTEQSELDDDSIEIIKERYRNMGIKMAIDDYGTGYSNVGNLLRYMPNFVKIDRSLLTDIQNNPKKRHFVREIIQFCHDNSILALAEGVETAEELRTVFLLGADLIQGYFTARPTPEIIDSIPEEIKQLIKRYHQERESGIDQQLYLADCTEHIMLERMVKSDIRCIVIGANGNGDVVIEGSPNLDSQIRIETRKGFTGKISLINAWLCGIKNKPCIDIAEDCDVKLNLIGDNKLDNGGVRVPESSKLTMVGEGRLEIELDSTEYYGIGNGLGLLHGELDFQQSGRITINAKGQNGIAIGSGNGGKINIAAGQYRLNLQGDVVVGIGAMYEKNDLTIHDCDIGMEITSARGVAIGSIGKSDDITIFKASVKLFMSGVELVGIGTLDGEKLKFEIYEASCFVTIKGDRCSAVAALEGSTDVFVHQAAVKVSVAGNQALGAGGFSGDTIIRHDAGDTHITIDTPINISDYVKRENLTSANGKFILTLNGNDIIESD